MSDAIIKKFQGSYLPHWRKKDGIYFVTFRLAGSVPSHLKKNREDLRKEIFDNAARTGREFSKQELDMLEEIHFEEIRLAPKDLNHRFLKDERIAKMLADAFVHFDSKRYQLLAWCIMPNHVHIVFRPLADEEVPKILQSWKGFSAREANKILGRTGKFWHEEYYDHLVRNEKQLFRCIEYTWMNPDKAGLKNWKWRWKAEEKEIAKACELLIATA